MTLGATDLVAFVPSTDLTRARAFYERRLGLRLIEESTFACAFDAHGTTLRVTAVEGVTPASHTVLGWTVSDIVATVIALSERGIEFELYTGVEQDDLGIWQTPGGARVAWFNDPDGNLLSVTQPRPADDA